MTDTNTNCGCGDGKFPYIISARDLPEPSELTPEQLASIPEGQQPTQDTVKWLAARRIATQYGLSVEAVLAAPNSINTPNMSHWSVGDIICLEGIPPREYRYPCEETELTLIDMMVVTELVNLIVYAETLGLAAQATPDTVTSPAISQFSDTNPDMDLAWWTLQLAQASGYATVGELHNIFGVDPNYDARTDMGYFSTLNGVEFSPDSILFDDTVDTHRIMSILQEVVADAEARGFQDWTLEEAQELVGDYEVAVASDEVLPTYIAQIRAELAIWDEVTEAGQLSQLNSKIEQMRLHENLVGVSVKHIIEAFDQFYRQMQQRHELLKTLKNQLAQINYLTLSPEERWEYDAKQAVLTWARNWPEFYRVDEGICSLNLPYDAFMECVRSTIQEAWEANPNGVRTALEDAGYDFEGFWGTVPKEPADDSQFFENLQRAMEIAFFIGGFIPVLSQFTDVVDIVVSLARGDIIGAALNFLPFDEILIGMRRLNGIADDIVRRAKGQLDEFLEEITRSRNNTNRLEVVFASTHVRTRWTRGRTRSNLLSGGGSSGLPPRRPRSDRDFEVRSRRLAVEYDEDGRPRLDKHNRNRRRAEGETAVEVERIYGVQLARPHGDNSPFDGSYIGDADYVDPDNISYDFITAVASSWALSNPARDLEQFMQSIDTHMAKVVDRYVIDVSAYYWQHRYDDIIEIYTFVDANYGALDIWWIPPRS